ncbi:hypothetical protein ACQ5SK_41805 [Bradyrhizobium japonicum]
MGDKIEAKKTARKLGIPVVPGSDGAVGPRTTRWRSPGRSASPCWSRRLPAAAAAA